MKRNKNFRIRNYTWPLIILMSLVGITVWANLEAIRPRPLTFDTDPSGMYLSGQAQQQPGQWTQPAPLAPMQPFPAPQPQMQPLPQVGRQIDNGAASTTVAVQQSINRIVSLVRPAVVAITRPGVPPAAVDGAPLSYIEPYAGNNSRVGSGLIVDPRGYVITTFQTVGRAQQVQVTLFSAERREYVADLIGVDAKTDLVLLRIRSNELFPTVILGNSEMIKVGDLVFAIGSPFGFSRTVTMGIVSSNRRQININGIRYPDMIQTDAAINEGNDGGPLVNVSGEVIGINMASFMPDNHNSGIGFAIPMSDAYPFIDSNI
jgi:S1-C subfamily serine protease